MNIVKLTKIIGLSTVTSQVCLFADTYKLEVTKLDGGAKVRFRADNLTQKPRKTDVLCISNMAGYDTNDVAVGGVITNVESGRNFTFRLGKLHVCYDYRDGLLRLAEGCLQDGLVIEKSDCPIEISMDRQLKVNTLIMKDIKKFRNRGNLNTWITVLQDCKTVRNQGEFHALNLFLLNTDIQNYGRIACGDTLRQVNCKIHNEVLARGFIRQLNNNAQQPAQNNNNAQQPAQGNNNAGLAQNGDRRLGTLGYESKTSETMKCYTLCFEAETDRMGWLKYIFGGFCYYNCAPYIFNPCLLPGFHTLISFNPNKGTVAEADAGFVDYWSTHKRQSIKGNVIFKSKDVSVVQYPFLNLSVNFQLQKGTDTVHYLVHN